MLIVSDMFATTGNSTTVSAASSSSEHSNGATVSSISTSHFDESQYSMVSVASTSSVATVTNGVAQPSFSTQTPSPVTINSISLVTSTAGYAQRSNPTQTYNPIPTDNSFAEPHLTGLTHSPFSKHTVNPSSASTSSIERSSSGSSQLSLSFYTTVGVPTIPPSIRTGEKKFVFSFKITNKACSVEIRENNAESNDYKILANAVVAAVNTAFRNDPYYVGSRVYKFDCGSVIPFVEVSKNGSATNNVATELKAAEDMVKHGTASGLSIDASSFSSSPTASSPNLYIELDTELSNSQFCLHKSNFKNQFANHLVSTDGQSFINPAQIVVFGSNCNDQSVSYNAAKVSFYVTRSTSQVVLPDVELTNRAYKIIRQYVEDGTTWRLSASFDNKVRGLLVYFSENYLVDKV